MATKKSSKTPGAKSKSTAHGTQKGTAKHAASAGSAKPTAAIRSVARVLPWILIVAGVIGLISSTIITYDKMQLLHNASYKPSCNLNPIISCGSVMSSAQSHVFGFSNSFIGMAAFPVLITIGVGVLAGARFKPWFWRGLSVGSALGVIFVHWLFFQSVYRIHALCPYCMVVWAATITTFVYSMVYNLETGALRLGNGPASDFVRRRHLDILCFWLLVIAALILKHFWYYYGKYL